MRLLIVDGDTTYRETLEKLTTQWGYHPCVVTSEDEAVEKLKFQPFDMVISEWNTLEVKGDALCSQLKNSVQGGYTYSIICSEKKETSTIVNAFEAGADDFIAKPFEPAELHARIEAGRRLLNLDRSLKQTTSRLERGLSQAARTLKSMLPPKRDDDNFRTDWLFRPCAIIGGDLFNMVDLDQDNVCLYAIDVSGHEIAAALFAVTLGHMLLPRRQSNGSAGKRQSDSYSWNQSPKQVVTTLNDRFQMEPPMNRYATLFYAVINRKTLKMRWVRAGHPAPIIVRDGKHIVLSEGEPPIGVFTDCTYAEHETQLQTNDRLVLYSDGISECQNPTSLEMLGSDRFAALLESLSQTDFSNIIENIDAALLDYRTRDTFDDDVSLLAIEIK